MQPFAKNMAVEYADKSLPNGELAKELKDLKDIPLLTEDNALDIFKKKPKEIIYQDVVYQLQDKDSDVTETYYSSIYGTDSLTIAINEDGDIESNLIEVADTANIKAIYCHPLDIVLRNGAGRLGCLIFNNSSMPFTKDTFVDFIEALYTQVGDAVRIITTGVIYSSGNGYPAVGILRRTSGTNLYSVYSSESDGTAVLVDYENAGAFKAAINFLNDGVNRIN